MIAKEFKDNEEGYQKWIKDNPHGYVLTTIRKISPGYMSLHRSSCRMISQYMSNMAEDAFTGRGYMKVCSLSTHDLLDWIRAHGGKGFTKCCSKCHPDLIDVRAYHHQLEMDVTQSCKDSNARKARLNVRRQLLCPVGDN